MQVTLAQIHFDKSKFLESKIDSHVFSFKIKVLDCRDVKPNDYIILMIILNTWNFRISNMDIIIVVTVVRNYNDSFAGLGVYKDIVQ